MSAPRKRCPKCGKEKPMTRRTFVVVTRDGRDYFKHCRVCDRKRQRELRQARRADPAAIEKERAQRRARRARNVEHYREYHRNYQAAWRAKLKREDPARYFETYILPHRFLTTKTRCLPGRDTYGPPDAKTDLLDAAPLRDFARRAYPKLDTSTLARIFRMDMHTARRVFEEDESRIALHVVDRALTMGLGRPDLLNLLYPIDAPEPAPVPVPTPDLIGAYQARKRARAAMRNQGVAA